MMNLFNFNFETVYRYKKEYIYSLFFSDLAKEKEPRVKRESKNGHFKNVQKRKPENSFEKGVIFRGFRA